LLDIDEEPKGIATDPRVIDEEPKGVDDDS